MRDRRDIEREIFHARQDLEQSVSLLAHRIRERAAIRARMNHAVRGFTRGHAVLISMIVAAVLVKVLISRKSRRHAASRRSS